MPLTFDTVIYRNSEDEEELVNAEEIALRSDYEVIKKNLHCSFEGCTSRIKYVPKSKIKAFFSTWPNDNHTEECLNYFERERKNASTKKIASSSAKLEDKHISNILKDMFKINNETLEEKELRLKKQREKSKKNKTKIVDKTQEPNTTVYARPSTSNDAEFVASGTRAPNVKRRFNIFDLQENDIGKATALIERVSSIELSEKRGVIGLKNEDKEVNVYLEEEFFATGYTNIDTILKVVQEAFIDEEELTLGCVGDVVKRNGKLCLIVNGQTHLKINDKRIDKFAFNYRSLDY